MLVAKARPQVAGPWANPAIERRPRRYHPPMATKKKSARPRKKVGRAPAVKTSVSKPRKKAAPKKHASKVARVRKSAAKKATRVLMNSATRVVAYSDKKLNELKKLVLKGKGK